MFVPSNPKEEWILDKQNRVKYMSETERKQLHIKMDKGVLTHPDGRLVHTENNQTASRGRGWMACAIDFLNRLYGNDHIDSKLHHSSFLAGGTVRFAGEMSVYNGKLVALSNKSGHYRPGPEAICRALVCFRDGGVNLEELRCMNQLTEGLWVRGDELLRTRGIYERCVLRADPPKIPGQAVTFTHRPHPAH